MASADLREELLCSICLNIYADPVTLRCGHNFCRECIERVLDSFKGAGAYNCPDCRTEFEERPTLHRNVNLFNIAQRFQSTKSAQVSDGLFCTYCIHSTAPAVKSCLHCEASLCENHLSIHKKSEEHILTDPIVFSERIRCTTHDKVLQYYCLKEGTCLCLLCCLVGGHSGHQVEPINVAMDKKKENLGNVLKKIIKNQGITEERLQSLKEQHHELHKKMTEETERVTTLFSNLREMVDDLEKKVLSHISRQDDHVSTISDLIREMEIKKDEMCSKICHLEELCQETDPWSVLQEPQLSQEDFFDSKDESILVDNKELRTEDNLDKVRISETLYHGLTDVMTYAKKTIFGHEERDILLDGRTAGINVEISDDLKTASWSQIKQNHLGARKSLHRCQVLSSRLFSSGRHCWTVETSKSGSWALGVCYGSMARSGDMADLGFNNKSWCLSKPHNSTQYSVMHNEKGRLIDQQSPCHRFRLYLDYEAGQLIFYELRDPIKLLHVVTAKFDEPLHAAFYVCNAWVRICS